MVSMRPGQSSEKIAQELMNKATEVWGPKRADAIRATLELTAERLWLLANNLPHLEEQPAFFSKE